MSASTVVCIACDGCGALLAQATHAREARRIVKDAFPGALCALPGGRDLCGTCVATARN